MYIELHARSAFSFLEGASLPEQLISVATEMNMPAMALVDRDGVYGAPRFHMAAKKKGLNAHIGAEIAMPGCRLPLLAHSRQGYQNLCQLITKMKLRAKKGEGEVHEKELEEFAAGLICLTGDEHGPLAAALTQDGMDEARSCIARLKTIFGDNNVYVELQRHFHRPQEWRNQAAIQIADSLNLPLLATNGVSYSLPRERELLDVFTALHHHKTLATSGKLLAINSERHLKTPKQMQALFADIPQAIQNTVELSSRLDFTLKDLGYQFPQYPVPEGETMMSFLRQRAWEGFRRRYSRATADLQQRARRQIERELTLIAHLKLEGYFLIVWDLVRYCGEQKILVQGRGSAANSAVCYSLGITAVDPVGMELLFERFLSEERGEWPDIDLDLPSGDQRERVIQYLYRRYGERGAAMTANVITYRNRMAAREMGKVLGLDNEMLSKVSAAVSAWEFKDENDALDKRFHDAGVDLRHPRLRKYFELCVAVQDLPRHLGQHSGGMVICQGQLDLISPLEPASMPGRVVIQWDKEDCNDLGIIKVDLLGLGMMAVLEDSLHLIRNHYKEEVDLAHLPADDKDVYATLQKADTVGMFQVESRAQMSCLPRLRPQRFYDIVVQVAIIRPGPIVGQMVNPYLQRRMGREDVTYPHPSLQPVLERTLGVPLFQEQLLRIAMVAANFSGGEAEELRRAMGFKRSQERMKEIEARLRSGMTHNGIPQAAQEQIILSIISFALYGFPESHAASFALIAYASAYLKCHYLAAFTAALLNNQPMGFYSPSTLVKDAQRHGLKVLSIDVTKSDWNCTLTSHGSAPPQIAMRMGLRYARGLRSIAAEALLAQRSRMPFESIRDLIHRVPELRKDELDTLAEIGALNAIPESSPSSSTSPVKLKLHRRDALWQVERAVRNSGPLLDNLPEPDAKSPLLPMNNEERLVADFRGTGLTVGPHPMAYHREEMARLGIVPAKQLATLRNGQRLRVGGCVITRQRPGTAKGFCFFSLEDETGVANAIIDPDLFQKRRLVITSGQFLMIEGILQNQDNVISVKAQQVEELTLQRIAVTSHDFH